MIPVRRSRLTHRLRFVLSLVFAFCDLAAAVPDDFVTGVELPPPLPDDDIFTTGVGVAVGDGVGVIFSGTSAVSTVERTSA